MANWVREWPLRDDVWTDRDFEQRDERLETREHTDWYEEWVPLTAGDELRPSFCRGNRGAGNTLSPAVSGTPAGPGVEGPTGDVTAGSSPAASPDPALAALVSMFEKEAA